MSLFLYFLWPVAVGDTCSSAEEGSKDHHTGCNQHIFLLLFLCLLEVPPLKITELTALSNIASYATATYTSRSLNTACSLNINRSLNIVLPLQFYIIKWVLNDSKSDEAATISSKWYQTDLIITFKCNYSHNYKPELLRVNGSSALI